jgi:hypothetical protein
VSSVAAERTRSEKEARVTDHKFKVSETVMYTAGPFGRRGVTDVYKIMQLLPAHGEDQQYRIKSANEPHERVGKESELARVL